MNDQELWGETLRAVDGASEGGNLDLWLRQARLLRLDETSAHVEVLNEFCRDWIRDRFLARLGEVLAGIVGRPLDIVLHLPESSPPVEGRSSSVPSSSASPARRPSDPPAATHPNYTFDRFVTGPSNQLAAAAARAVARQLGEAAHPLYVYAPSGLGKTHLLHAVAHEARARYPRLRIACLSTQRLVEEYVQFVRSFNIEAFDRRYRDGYDLLLLDDIHILSGKDGSQERFFHIYNALYDRRVPIVMTSDQRPKEIADLQERLRTRFAWGLLVDIQPPEFETRLAILQAKAEEEGAALPQDAAERIAHHVRGSIRELEGALGRLVAQARLTHRPLDAALADEVLAALLPVEASVVTIDDIQRAVCALYGVSPSDLRSPSRRRAVVVPRHVAMYLARHGLNLAFPTIAEHFGRRDHTTAVAACRQVARLVETDAAIRSVVQNLRRQLGLP
jgi:chromosomal replication initiator protein